jgi:protein TonB
LKDTTYLDTIFETRNKAFGAYDLRKGYLETIKTSLFITNSLFLIIILLVYNFSLRKSFERLEAKGEAGKFNVLQVELLPKESGLDIPSVNQFKISDSEPEPRKDTTENNKPISKDKEKKKEFELSPDGIYEQVDENAEYPGGWPALINHYMTNIEAMDRIKSEGIDALIILKFAVKEDGNVYKVHIFKGIDSECDQELLRLTETLEKLKPAKKKGKKVKQWISLPIHFSVPKSQFHGTSHK